MAAHNHWKRERQTDSETKKQREEEIGTERDTKRHTQREYMDLEDSG